MKQIRVLVVDDSAVVRNILQTELSLHEKIDVIATAPDPFIARNKLEKLEVDVVILDIEMPRMDGLTFLKYLNKYLPLPVIIVSSLAHNNTETALRALELGAVSVVPKPGGPFSVTETVNLLKEKVIETQLINRKVFIQNTETSIEQLLPEHNASRGHPELGRISTTDKIMAIGASTGGTKALEKIFRNLHPDCLPILTVIHMPQNFTGAFANRLNSLSSAVIKEAEDGELISPGTVYIAPGDYHLTVRTTGKNRFLRVSSGPKLFNQRPSVDVLFNSVSQELGRNCTAYLLTGMGKDGAEGLLRIKNSGGITVAQDEQSSIIFGMPKAAIDINAAITVLSLDDICKQISEARIK